LRPCAAGTPNKVTRDLREIISTALVNAGGVKYLERQAQENAPAFLALLGKLLPKEVNLNANTSCGVGYPHLDLAASCGFHLILTS
jgi:hypothetical protein